MVDVTTAGEHGECFCCLFATKGPKCVKVRVQLYEVHGFTESNFNSFKVFMSL